MSSEGTSPADFHPDWAKPTPGKRDWKRKDWLEGVEYNYGSAAAYELKWDLYPLPTDYHIEMITREVENGDLPQHELAIVQTRLPDPTNPRSDDLAGTDSATIGSYESAEVAQAIQKGLHGLKSEVFDLLGKDESDSVTNSTASALMATVAHEIAVANGMVAADERFFGFPDPIFDERTPVSEICEQVAKQIDLTKPRSTLEKPITSPAEIPRQDTKLDLEI